nr:MAG TPA: hypothetical protein [Caudoviricetes sp.]
MLPYRQSKTNHNTPAIGRGLVSRWSVPHSEP